MRTTTEARVPGVPHARRGTWGAWLGTLVLSGLIALGAGGDAGARETRPDKAGRSGAHGALAYNAKTGAFGFSHDFPQSRAAKEAALAQCGEPACIVMVNFRNACAALVQGEKRPFVAQGVTRDEASARAMNKCKDEAKCKPVAWACTR